MSTWKKLFGRRGKSKPTVSPSSRYSPLGFEALEGRWVPSAVRVTAAPAKDVAAIVAPATSAASVRVEGKATEGVATKLWAVNAEVVAKSMPNPEDGTDDQPPPVPPHNPDQPPIDLSNHGPGPWNPWGFGGGPRVQPEPPATAATTPTAAVVAKGANAAEQDVRTVEDLLTDVDEFNVTDVENIVASKMPGYGQMGFWEGLCEGLFSAAGAAAGGAVGGAAGAAIGGAIGNGIGAEVCEGLDDDTDGHNGSGNDGNGGARGNGPGDNDYPAPDDPYGALLAQGATTKALAH